MAGDFPPSEHAPGWAKIGLLEMLRLNPLLNWLLWMCRPSASASGAVEEAWEESVLLAWPMRGKIGADDSFASGATLTGKAGSFASALGCSNITPCPRVQLNASSSPVKSQQPFWRGLLSGRRFKLSTKNCAPSTGDPISRDGTKTSSFWIYVLVGTVIFTALIVGDSRDPRY